MDDYYQYVSPSTGRLSKELLNHAAYQTDDVFTDWLMPGQKEERQMGQQLIMDRVEPMARMRGLKEAGINPLTAAAGIAGQSSNSPQPASSVNPIGDVTGALGALSNGFGSVAGGVSELTKLDPELKNIEADTSSKLAGIGLTNAQTQGVLTDNTYKDEDWKTRLNVQRQQFENMKQEYQNLKATHDEILKHIDEMQSQIELNGSVEDYNKAMQDRINEETRWLKAKDDFCIAHKLFINDSGIAGYIFSMVESGADMSQFDKFIEYYSDFREAEGYANQKGVSRAERLFGTSKSPWELGDKYLNRFVEWIRSNGEDDPEIMKEQIQDIAARLSQDHPDWDRDRIIKALYSFGFTNDEVYNAFN